MYRVIKHFKFDEKVEPSVFRGICQGMCNIVEWGTNTRGGPAALQFLFDNVGGTQFRHWTFNAELAAKVMTKSDIDKGIDFILAEAPRTNADLKQKRWCMHQAADTESPIYDWDPRDVRECMNQIKETSVTSTKHTYIPCTWLDIDPKARAIIGPLIPSLKRKSIIFLGEAGMGKTPLSHVLLMVRVRAKTPPTLVCFGPQKVPSKPFFYIVFSKWVKHKNTQSHAIPLVKVKYNYVTLRNCMQQNTAKLRDHT